MEPRKYNKNFKWVSLLAISTTSLSGCNCALLNPAGQIGLEQRSLIIIAFGLMLIAVIPTILMTALFVSKYRANKKTINLKYSPNWSNSNEVEIVVWIIPILIIIFLATLTWKTTHSLEPSKQLFSYKKSIPIEVVSMDWKWLFIYPEQNIATINEIAFPVNTELEFKITSNSVMNSFFIPCLGSQIYAMAGMQTNLHLVANKTGTYNGISASYSGHGFSGMKFKVIVMPNRTAFDLWIAKVKQSSKNILNMNVLEEIAIPTQNNKVEYFSAVKTNLFKDVINKFMNHNKTKH